MSSFMMFSGGNAVDIENFNADELSIEEIALSLARVNRFAGHTRKGVVYTVAEHSVWVSYAVPHALAYPALMHDVEEAVFSDIPKPVKHLSKEIIRAGDEVRAQLWFALGCYATSREWEYIHAADYLALQTEARDLMHPNIERFIPFPKEYSRTIFPLMNEDDIVQQFMDRYNEVSGVKTWRAAVANLKSSRVA